jgi:hypothetical protein
VSKKNDQADIANYRPISLLNTDYKLMTKALSLKLAKVAIHEDQAGFVPGHQIYDHIWLSKLIINLAELEDIEGAMVALDQETKSSMIIYGESSKIWNPRSFHPDCEISFVNGVGSAFFRVVRGVRQGDPLSCLLRENLIAFEKRLRRAAGDR